MRRGLLERIKQANAPPPPEESVPLRIATAVAVVVGIVACASVGELSTPLAAASVAAVTGGMIFSYVTRHRPWQWPKLALALAVVIVFVEFVHQILRAAHSGQLTSIEVPLAGLFTWVQVIHSFDVPARRDLLFSVAAGAALLTIGGAQAVSGSFAVFVVVWLVATMVALSCSWQSMSHQPSALAPGHLVGSLLAVVVIALALLVVLPQPRAAQSLTLPAALGEHLPLSGTGIVNGTGSHPNEPAKPGKPGGKIGVGGYVGFSRSLQTADRAALGNEVVMRVRADRPGYFLGMTYDTWNGQSWLRSPQEQGSSVIAGGSPFELPPRPFTGVKATSNVQTFYVEQPMPNLLFATSDPLEVYFPAKSLVVGRDGSIRSQVAITPGTVYTVISADDEASQAALSADRGRLGRETRSLPAVRAALALPHPYPRVAALARSIVTRAHASTTDGIVLALEAWMGSHTEYTTNIPPLRSGQDTVTEFLFGNRKGYCEQISTSLAVMLRTLGIPTREAIGYVPGPFDPLSNLYEIQAKDAHAWVQVYFPGYGWQNFDPTASVPLAPANPGAALLGDLGAKLAALPWTPIGTIAGLTALSVGLSAYDRRRRARPTTWPGRVALRLERLGARSGIARGPTETLGEYASRLERAHPGFELPGLARALEDAAYASERADPAPEHVAAVDRLLRRFRTETGRVARARLVITRRLRV